MTGKGWKSFKLVSMLLVITALICALCIAQFNEVRFWLMLGVVSVVSIVYLGLFLRFENNLHSFVSEMESQLNLTERDSLYKFPAPALIVDSEGIIIWFNKAFTEQIHSDDAYGVHLNSIIGIDLEQTFSQKETVIEYQAGHYRITAVTTEKCDENGAPVSELTLLCFEDISDYISAKTDYENSRVRVMIILVDSYDELFSNIKDSDKAHITIQIDKMMETFVEERHGILKKIASDRFFALISENELKSLEGEHFRSILEKAHTITTGGHTPITVSIGVGRGGDSLPESESMAKQALDMTQGRGGDQVAVKDDDKYTFYGGSSTGVEKSTKVKTRIFSSSLESIIAESDMVIIMGHSWGDLDAIGAAAGICGAARLMGASAYVYSNTEKTLAGQLIDRLRDNIDDEGDIFITEEEALAAMTDRTLVIITDTNNKDLLDSPRIYSAASKVVFIDHHRMVVNSIDNAILSLHEPYASSASEMVAEVIQYFSLDGKLPSYYADALLAGIMLDTKNFVTKTGVRTFEAAAYLKKLGADTIAVKLLFATSIDTGILRSKIIESAEIYKDCAIALCDEKQPDIRVAASQAADELLSISGVDASFVIFRIENGVNISGRSYGTLNVQVILEKLGGGGHQTMAAAQLKDITCESARVVLTQAIDEHIRNIS